MSFEEKLTWVNSVVTVIVSATYFTLIGGKLGETPVAEVAYQVPLLVAVGAMIVLTIVGSIGTAIATAIGIEITGEGSVDDIDRKDERDIDINRRGDLASYYVSSAFMLGVLAMAMLEQPHFWIANAMFAAFVTAGLVGSFVKLASYRRGF